MDENGNELTRELIPQEPGLVLQVVRFVDLGDGRRVTTEASGAMSLSMPAYSTLDELREGLREFVFEDDIREVDEALAEERWTVMASALRAHGIVADDEALGALPFRVELDDDVVAA